MEQYDDIIDRPYPVSTTRPRMSRTDRAAQFSPFAALTGYEAVLRETGRLTKPKIELSEDSRAALDRKQRLLLEHIAECPQVTVTYFVSDERKDGGAYVTVPGRVKRVDPAARVMTLTDGTNIPLEDILELESDRFPVD